jgi:hypothetical protein
MVSDEEEDAAGDEAMLDDDASDEEVARSTATCWVGVHAARTIVTAKGARRRICMQRL